MINIESLHMLTIKAILHYEIDCSKFDSVEELRKELKHQQYLRFKEKYRQYYREKMGAKYKENPDKYRIMRRESRQKMLESDPSYKEKMQNQSKEYRLRKKHEKLKVLGLVV